MVQQVPYAGSFFWEPIPGVSSQQSISFLFSKIGKCLSAPQDKGRSCTSPKLTKASSSCTSHPYKQLFGQLHSAIRCLLDTNLLILWRTSLQPLGRRQELGRLKKPPLFSMLCFPIPKGGRPLLSCGHTDGSVTHRSQTVWQQRLMHTQGRKTQSVEDPFDLGEIFILEAGTTSRRWFQQNPGQLL